MLLNSFLLLHQHLTILQGLYLKQWSMYGTPLTLKSTKLNIMYRNLLSYLHVPPGICSNAKVGYFQQAPILANHYCQFWKNMIIANFGKIFTT